MNESYLPEFIECPWCHSPMTLHAIECDDGVIRRSDKRLRDYYYECDVCGAQSPNVYEVCTHEMAAKRLRELCKLR